MRKVRVLALLFLCAAGANSAEHETDGNWSSVFEIHQVADDTIDCHRFVWENLPDRPFGSVNLKREAAADASILVSARVVPAFKGPYAGYWDIQVFFNPAGGDAFDLLNRSNVGKKVAYVVCGRAVAVDGIAGISAERYRWQSRQLGAFLPREKADRLVAAINNEIAHGRLSSNQGQERTGDSPESGLILRR